MCEFGSHGCHRWKPLAATCGAPGWVGRAFCRADVMQIGCQGKWNLQLASVVHIWEIKLQSGVRLSTYPGSILSYKWDLCKHVWFHRILQNRIPRCRTRVQTLSERRNRGKGGTQSKGFVPGGFLCAMNLLWDKIKLSELLNEKHQGRCLAHSKHTELSHTHLPSYCYHQSSWLNSKVKPWNH